MKKAWIGLLGSVMLLASCGEKLGELSADIGGEYDMIDYHKIGSYDGLQEYEYNDKSFDINTFIFTHNEAATNALTWHYRMHVDFRLGSNVNTGVLQESVNGTWEVVEYKGSTPDSMYITIDNETLGYEIESFEDSVLTIHTHVGDSADGGVWYIERMQFDKI